MPLIVSRCFFSLLPHPDPPSLPHTHTPIHPTNLPQVDNSLLTDDELWQLVCALPSSLRQFITADPDAERVRRLTARKVGASLFVEGWECGWDGSVGARLSAEGLVTHRGSDTQRCCWCGQRAPHRSKCTLAILAAHIPPFACSQQAAISGAGMDRQAASHLRLLLCVYTVVACNGPHRGKGGGVIMGSPS